MRRSLAWMALLCLSACASHYRYSSFSTAELKPNRYRISYHGDPQDFAKVAAFYRSAELCLEKGSRYFRIREEGPISRYLPAHRADPAWESEKGRGVDEALTQGHGEKALPAGYSYMVDFYREDPQSGDAEDAQKIIDEFNVPGTKHKKYPNGVK